MQNFFGGFFQLGYVTRDLDAAIAQYRKRFGEVEFAVNEPPAINGVPAPTRRIALAWIDEVMTEIIEPDPAQTTIYDDLVPATAGPIALHHFGYLIDDHEAMLQRCTDMGYAVPMAGKMPGALGYIYADTRAELGHWVEFITLEEGGRQFFGSVPRCKTR